ncbi:hypothetical protein C9374_011798 [Naegleria lovaniensis]|uniref:F-box domain-containing protein n=1 Tax=Naegleria lovaniensis TaxID=51637 RepID=A0AA88GFM2_NAELO|nr:uncharacterized protein C9374_011798 [Naegleria lovaniensis]KAG2373709.1 hypothetical protein C9374_011798 [Naegleria lovaniensis]
MTGGCFSFFRALEDDEDQHHEMEFKLFQNYGDYIFTILPPEIVDTIFEYLHTFQLLTLMRVNVFVEFRVLRFIIMGDNDVQYLKKRDERLGRNIKSAVYFPSASLHFFLDALMRYSKLMKNSNITAEDDFERVLRIYRFNLTIFNWKTLLEHSNSRSSKANVEQVLKKLQTLIEAFQIQELVIGCFEQVLKWLDTALKNTKQPLRSIKRLTVLNSKSRFHFKQPQQFHMSNLPLQALHGYLVKSITDVQHLCAQQKLCNNLEFLTIVICESERNTLDLVLRNVLTSMPNLLYLSLEISVPFFERRCTVIIDDQMVELLQQSKLKRLKIPKGYKTTDVSLVLNTNKVIKNCLPKVEELLLICNIHPQNIEMHNALMVLFPLHPLKEFSYIHNTFTSEIVNQMSITEKLHVYHVTDGMLPKTQSTHMTLNGNKSNYTVRMNEQWIPSLNI